MVAMTPSRLFAGKCSSKIGGTLWYLKGATVKLLSFWYSPSKIIVCRGKVYNKINKYDNFYNDVNLNTLQQC
jgi:hypothetical protein